MAASILNATPMSFALGTNDVSGRIVTPEPLPRPQHLPKFYFWAKRGPVTPELMSGDMLLEAYGSDTFNPLKKYYNNAQLFISNIVAQGNLIMSQRLKPSDATTATVVIGVEYQEVSDFYYNREADGSYTVDGLGDPTKSTDPLTVNMIRHVKIVLDDFDPTQPLTFAGGTEAGWTFVPIMHYKAAAHGEDYNNVGVRIQSISATEFNQEIANAEKALTYNLSIMRRDDAYTSPKVVNTLYNEDSITVSFKAGAINPATAASIDIADLLPNEWYNTEDQTLPLRYDDFEKVYVYHDNIASLLDTFMALEAAEVDATNVDWFDYSGYDPAILAEEAGLIDFFSCTSTKGIPYFTVRLDNSVTIDDGMLVYGSPADGSAITLPMAALTEPVGSAVTYASYIDYTSGSPVFMGGGSDGTLSEAEFETAFITEMDKYNDASSDVMDMAINLETVMYDIGYNLDAKYALANFIAKRKNTFVFFTTVKGGAAHNTYTASEGQADMLSTATAIYNVLKFMPESTYFGTSVMRGLISQGDYIVEEFSKSNPVPVLLDLAIKFAQYAGASNYKWKPRYRFDRSPGSLITSGKRINPSNIPEPTKQALWKANIVYPQPYDRTVFFFPAVQSVYNDDTSVLNSALTALAVCTLNTIGYDAWKEHTGSIHLTNDQLKDSVVGYINDRVNGIFDGMYNIVPEVTMTKRDEQRGYSWTLVIRIYANNMKTVQTMYVEAHRMEQ